MISVIVPIYKVEKYLNTCVDSLINQTCNELEIILVNDGSTDGCPKICDEYAKRYDNIKVIHKANGGLVSARKVGAAAASCEYITFVDGDDWVDTDYFEKILKIIKEHRPELVCVNKLYEAGENYIRCIDSNNGLCGMYTKNALVNGVLSKVLYTPPFYSFGIMPSLCSKIFRKDILLRYISDEPENITMGEDLAVSLPCILNAESIYFADICGYYYRQNPTSITHTFDRGLPNKIITLLEQLEKNITEDDIYGIKYQLAMYSMHIAYFAVTSLINGSTDLKNDLTYFKPLWKNMHIKNGLKQNVPKKIKVLLFASRHRMIFLLKILKKRWVRQKG